MTLRKALVAVLLAAAFLTGCSVGPAPVAAPEANSRFEKCVRVAKSDYIVKNGQAHYWANLSKANLAIDDACRKVPLGKP